MTVSGSAVAYWLTGDTRRCMAALPAGSVDLVMSSPPFLGLRDYLEPGDPAKVDEIGSEPGPAEFVDTLLEVTEACARLLAPHGSLCFELGDTYAGSGGASGDYDNGGLRDAQPRFKGSGSRARPDAVKPGTSTRLTSGTGWPLDKSLSLIPEAYRFALAYGHNPHNGRRTDPWRIRNVIRWVRPNPSPGALGDKFRPGTSEIVVACKSARRWFDLDAVRQPHSENTHAKVAQSVHTKPNSGKAANDERRGGNHSTLALTNYQNPAGTPPLDWWKINPRGYKGAHYAVYPPELCVRPIQAMCPRRVCLTCAEPSRRQVAASPGVGGGGYHPGRDGGSSTGGVGRSVRITTTTGWSTCGCPGTDGLRLDGWHTGTGWRPGIVLDPFAGSGTTNAVASRYGRTSIGIDLDHRNVPLAQARLGHWLHDISPQRLATILTPAGTNAA